MGFWIVPLAHQLTQSAMGYREQFHFYCLLSLAGATRDARVAEQLMAAIGVADPPTYGSASPAINRAYAFMKALRDAQTQQEVYRVCDRAVSALKLAGAVDDTLAVS